jgi:hypothetical protein
MFEKDYLIKGKHATMAKFLKGEKDAKSADVFERIIDVYILAPIIGLQKNLFVPQDASKDEVRIFADAMIREKQILKFIYRLVCLCDERRKITADQKVDNAFRNDINVQEGDKTMETFHSYMRGGIEWLYNQFNAKTATREDYLGKMVELVNDMRDQLDGDFESKIREMLV